MSRQGFVSRPYRDSSYWKNRTVITAGGIIENGEVTSCTLVRQPMMRYEDCYEYPGNRYQYYCRMYLGSNPSIRDAVPALSMTLCTAWKTGEEWLHIHPARLRDPDATPLRPGHIVKIMGRHSIITAVGERCFRLSNCSLILEVGREIVRVPQQFELGFDDEASEIDLIHDYALTR